MRLATRQECQLIDKLSQEEYGLSGLALMERAGALASERLLKLPSAFFQKTVVVCGRGNNGGDGLVIARHIFQQHKNTEVLVLPGSESDLFQIQLKKLTCPVHYIETLEDLLQHLKNSHLIIDAVFGVGLNRALSQNLCQMIGAINKINAFRVAIDVPSGLNCDTGWDYGAALKAHMTLTFGIAKVGFYINHGPTVCGEIEVLDIGFPTEIVSSVASSVFAVDKSLAKELLPRRHHLSNKSDYGRLAVIAGSPGTWGAGVLSSKAALRTGVGFLYFLSHEDPTQVLGVLPELMTSSVQNFSKWDQLEAVVVGPGLGTGHDSEKLLSERKWQAPTVLDADALTLIARGQQKLDPQCVITPHTGELSRLMNMTVDELEYDRIKSAREAANKYNCVVVFKGFHSIVSDGKKSAIVLSGNSALAKAGSGDVLSGIIGGFLAQGLPAFNAAILGAYIHGAAADLWVSHGGHESSLLISELIDILPRALSELSK